MSRETIVLEDIPAGSFALEISQIGTGPTLLFLMVAASMLKYSVTVSMLGASLRSGSTGAARAEVAPSAETSSHEAYMFFLESRQNWVIVVKIDWSIAVLRTWEG